MYTMNWTQAIFFLIYTLYQSLPLITRTDLVLDLNRIGMKDLALTSHRYQEAVIWFHNINDIIIMLLALGPVE